jgi:hypothetical protein
LLGADFCAGYLTQSTYIKSINNKDMGSGMPVFIKQFLFVAVASLFLTSCFEMTVYSRMNDAGLVNNNIRIVTNGIFVAAFDETVRKLRQAGKNVTVKTDGNGNVVISWNETGFPFSDIDCKGIWIWKKCHAQHKEQIPADSKSKQGGIFGEMLISELTPELHYYFDMPKKKYIDSNADKVLEPDPGVYRMYWGRKLVPGQQIFYSIDYKP